MRKFKVSTSITNRDNEIFKTYLKEISHYPLISIEEERELAKKIQKGDKKAKDKLVISNLRFVVSVAKQYQGQGLDLMDLINEGNAGLITAAERYNPEKGCKFISYAVWWIRQSIIQALSTHSRTIRLPVSQSSKIIRIIKEINKFEQEHNRKPSNEELGNLLEINPNKIDRILSSSSKIISYDVPFDDEECGSLLDIIPNKNAKLSDSLTSESDLTIEIKDLLETLSEREHDILVLTYGLLGTQPLPYDEVGKLFGITGERVRQIHTEVIKKIKKENINLAKELL